MCVKTSVLSQLASLAGRIQEFSSEVQSLPSKTPRLTEGSNGLLNLPLQIHWPDRYVPLFGAAAYDVANERDDDIPFEEQLKALDNVVRAGKVRPQRAGMVPVVALLYCRRERADHT